ncbi:MAG: hypothetical protein HWE20_09210 [Gammaproteobacteria bacterium]|nr:hypothetical protein [Gammaproteobacteria bacterium]
MSPAEMEVYLRRHRQRSALASVALIVVASVVWFSLLYGVSTFWLWEARAQHQQALIEYQDAAARLRRWSAEEGRND